MEALDQRLRFRIGVGIERLVRVAIAGQEALQPQYIAALGVADDDGPARSRLDQAHTTQDQGAHDPLAELRLRHQQGPQPLRRDDQASTEPWA